MTKSFFSPRFTNFESAFYKFWVRVLQIFESAFYKSSPVRALQHAVLKSSVQAKQMLYFCVETIMLMYFNTFEEHTVFRNV